MSKFKKGDMVIVRRLSANPIEVVVGELDRYRCLVVKYSGEYHLIHIKFVQLAPKKVKYLKPLHVVLEEASRYEAGNEGDEVSIEVYSDKNTYASIAPAMFSSFGEKFSCRNDKFYYRESWIEEKEV